MLFFLCCCQWWWTVGRSSAHLFLHPTRGAAWSHRASARMFQKRSLARKCSGWAVIAISWLLTTIPSESTQAWDFVCFWGCLCAYLQPMRKPLQLPLARRKRPVYSLHWPWYSTGRATSIMPKLFSSSGNIKTQLSQSNTFSTLAIKSKAFLLLFVCVCVAPCWKSLSQRVCSVCVLWVWFMGMWPWQVLRLPSW